METESGLTDDEYRKLQDAFLPLDNETAEFAGRTHASYSRWNHGIPRRRFLYVGEDGITRCVDVTPIVYTRGPRDDSGHATFVKRKAPEFLFGVAAWKDGDRGRRIWHREIDRRATLPEPEELRAMLQQMLELVNSIREEDLT